MLFIHLIWKRLLYSKGCTAVTLTSVVVRLKPRRVCTKKVRTVAIMGIMLVRLRFIFWM